MNSMSEKSRASRKYWDAVWRSRDNAREKQSRNQSYDRFLGLLSGSLGEGEKVLDIGVGGPSDFLISLSKKGFDTYGIDFSPVGLMFFKQRARKYGIVPKLVLCDAKMLPFRDDAFDLVYSRGTIEHIPNKTRMRGDFACLKEHVRVAKPSGRVIITVPNFLALHFYFYIMIIHFRQKIEEEEKHYTFYQVKKMMRKAGLKNITVTGIGIVPPFESLGTPGRMVSILFKSFGHTLEMKECLLSKCLGWFIAAEGIKTR